MIDDTVLFEGEDRFGPIRVTEQPSLMGPLRMLGFGPADEQSRTLVKKPWVLQHEYTQAMMLSLLFCTPKRALVLGVGGGCLISALVKGVKGIKVTGVELRPLVTELAHKYFGLPSSKRIELVHQDAQSYLDEGGHKKVDLVMADIYGADAVAEDQLKTDFVTQAAAQLKSSGVLVLNCWAEHQRHPQLMAALATHFVDCRGALLSSGNYVIIASKVEDTQSGKQLREKLSKISDVLEVNLGHCLSRLEAFDPQSF